MYVFLKGNSHLHWWGDSLVLICELGNYLFEDIEKELIIKLAEHDCETDAASAALASELGVPTENADGFVQTFLDNFKDYFITAKKPGKPFTITGERGAYYPIQLHLTLTNSCPHHCVHCYKCAIPNGHFVQADAIFRLLDALKGKTPFLDISGGEPTLHPAFRDIVERYHKDFEMAVLTSGYGIDKYLELMLLAERGMSISVYSSHASVHDAFVGVPGSFDVIVNTVKKAVGMGVNVSITAMLTPDNLDDLKELTDFFTGLGVKLIQIGEIAPIGRAKLNNLFEGKDVPESVQMQMDAIASGNATIRYEREEHKANGLPLVPLSLLPCGGGSTVMYIDEDGEIQPCAFCLGKHFSMGNLNDVDLDTILHDRAKWMAEYPLYNSLHVSFESDKCPIEVYLSAHPRG